nr:hypothetical protein [Tanacetum cinerariifolium]
QTSACTCHEEEVPKSCRGKLKDSLAISLAEVEITTVTQITTRVLCQITAGLDTMMTRRLEDDLLTGK